MSTPILRTCSGCCARAASGHATAAPPRSVMNSRRLITAPKHSGHGIVSAQTSTLEGRDVRASQWPLWVISGHVQRNRPCPLYPQKRTCAVQEPMSAGSIADITQRELHVRFVTKRDFSPSYCCFFVSRLRCGRKRANIHSNSAKGLRPVVSNVATFSAQKTVEGLLV